MSGDESWIWGRHPVLEALRSGTVRRVLIAAGRSPAHVLREIREAAAQQDIQIREVQLQEIERLLPHRNTQGIAAEIAATEVVTVQDLIEATVPQADSRFMLALDQIQDPQNLGSLLRSASAAGVQGVVLPQRRSAPLSGTVAKVSAGAVNHLLLAEASNFARALDDLRRAGLWTVGLDGTAEQSLYALDLRMPLALVVGSEGAGMRRLTRDHCDFVARIPMPGPMESLNAAVAGAVAMFEVVRQRLSDAPTSPSLEGPTAPPFTANR